MVKMRGKCKAKEGVVGRREPDRLEAVSGRREPDRPEAVSNNGVSRILGGRGGQTAPLFLPLGVSRGGFPLGERKEIFGVPKNPL